ncbi:MAG: methyltransferase, partial [Gallionella sp.]|nr:methyltransferase [Gallionella sp.]
MSEYPVIVWNEAGKACSARWRSESGMPPPKRVIVADDTMKSVDAYRLACEGTALLWRGDFHNAKQLLQAMSRRADHKPRK